MAADDPEEPARPAGEIRHRRVKRLPRVLGFLVGVGIVALLIATIYVFQIHPLYDYMGYNYHGLQWVRLLPVAGFLAYPLLLLPGRVTRPSHLALWILYLGAYVPGCIVPALAYPPHANVAWQTPAIQAGGFTIMAAIMRMKLPRFRVPRILLPRWLFATLVATMAALPLLMLLHSLGFQMNLDLATHYDRRFTAREITTLAPILGYASEWLGYFFVPLLAGLAVHQRSLLLGFVAASAVPVLFAFDGTKGSLIMFIAGAAIAWGARHPRWLQPSRMIAGLALLLTAALAEEWLHHTVYLMDYFVRRVAVVPGLLSSAYIDFFSQHPPLLLSDVSGFRLFLHNPYGSSAAMVIGEQYFATPGANANAGIWPSAFAELRLFGVLAFSTLGALGLFFFDQLWRSRRDLTAFLGAAITALVWIEIPLHSSLISAGVIFWFILPMLGLRRRVVTGAHPDNTGDIQQQT